MPAHKPAAAKRTARTRNLPPKPSPDESTPLGRRLVANMERLVATARTGGMKAVEKKFTVREVTRAKFDTPAFGAKEVAAVRLSLRASQPVFAALIGVTPAAVRAWEHGTNRPSGVAARFLAEIAANPALYRKRIAAAAEK